jgi:hypothetical protein
VVAVVQVSLHRFLREFHCLLARMADKGGSTTGLSVCAHGRNSATGDREGKQSGQKRFHLTAPQKSAN